MTSPWTPEHHVDAMLAERLITEQFPQLAPVRVKQTGIGWDNIVYQLDSGMLFRFPQRKMAVEGVAREIAWLPRLEAANLPVPGLRHAGIPGLGYDWPFFGYLPIEGVEACELHLTRAQRATLARPLANFLRKLHSAPLFEQAVSDAMPVDPVGRLDFKRRALMTRERLAVIKAAGIELAYTKLDSLLTAAEQESPQAANALVHGDLHFRHIILRPDASFSGVIDWGDLHLNSPAVDLQLVFSLLPPEAREAFWLEYGRTIDESCTAITRGFAVFLNAALLFYALKERLTSIQSEAELALSWI